MAADRPEGLDVAGQGGGLGHLRGPHRPVHPAPRGISYFLVDMTSPGVTVRPLREMTGDALFNEVFLDDVLVPDDLVVGEVATAGGWPGPRWPTSACRCRGPGRSAAARRNCWRCCAGWARGPAGLLGAGRAAGGRGARDRRARHAGHAEAAVRDRAGRHRQRPQAARHAPRAARSRSCAGPCRARKARWRSASAGPAQVLLTRALTIGGGTTDIQLNIIGERHARPAPRPRAATPASPPG